MNRDCGLIWRLYGGRTQGNALPTTWHGCWEALVSHHQRSLHRTSDLREAVPKTAVQSFYDLISEATPHRFCHILFIRSKSLNPTHMHWEGMTLWYKYLEVGIPGVAHHGITDRVIYVWKKVRWWLCRGGHSAGLLNCQGVVALSSIFFPSLEELETYHLLEEFLVSTSQCFRLFRANAYLVQFQDGPPWEK